MIAPIRIGFGDTLMTLNASVVPIEILPDSASAIAHWRTDSALDEANRAAAFRYFAEHLVFRQGDSKLAFHGSNVALTAIGPTLDNLVVRGTVERDPVAGPVAIEPRGLFTENRSGPLQPVGEMKGPGFEEIHFFSGGAAWTEPVTRSVEERARHALSFILTGIWHIFLGYDHILFLLGLHITSPRIRETIKIVTAFTVAHSVTLVLAATGVITMASTTAEPLIALSIAYIGAENLWNPEPRGRWKTASLFGLVHGFGFASVLETFLRAGKMDRPTFAGSLFCFNVGVEIGQVAIVALLAPFWMNLKRIPGRAAIVNTISALIAFAGLYWFMERVFFMPR